MSDTFDLPELHLSSKVQSIPEALSIYINNLIYKMKHSGEQVMTLSLGEAHFDLPYFGFDDLDFSSGYHYSESRGIPEIRECISRYYADHYAADVDASEEILVSAGSKPLIFMALQAILEPGDEVLIMEPAWLSYPEQVKLAGGIPVFVPYACNLEDLDDFITSKTKAIIINNPNNPAGRLYTKDELLLIYGKMRKTGAYMIVDEAYSDFVNDASFSSMATLVPAKEGIIVANSLSKNLGMSGWRIGYCIAKPEVIFAMLKLNQHLITCTSTILLMYVAKHFDQLVSATQPQVSEVVSLRNDVRDYATSIGLRVLPGDSTFYLFLDVSEYGRPSLDLAMHLLFKHQIGVVPGSAYGKSTDGFIRIGVGVESLEDMKRALDTISQTIVSKEYDANAISTGLKKLGSTPFECA